MYVTNVSDLKEALRNTDTLIGHNIIGFDMPVLYDVWGFSWRHTVLDTYIMSRLYDPTLQSHSLKACAERAGGALKGDYDDWDGGLTDAMIKYCLADCVATWSVYEDLKAKLEAGKFSQYCIDLEHRVKQITVQQERNGFAFDFSMGCRLYNEHEERMNEIEATLQEVFPPIVEERWSDKTGKRLKDKVTTFNPGSRQQVASRLEAKGAVWTERTETGKPKVDETTLATLKHIPEANLVLEYLTLGKRIGMLRSWIDNCKPDGRIYGRVNTLGTITGRMSHSKPNLGQIPSNPLYRKCFTVEEGNKLVGVDASGLELRMLAHYMQDQEYTDLILHGDIHTHNQKAAGLAERSQAKTFIYAFLYGAGDAKIGSITGGGAAEGKKLKEDFLSSLPALATLLRKVRKNAATGRIIGLDGRYVMVRSEHSALNTLLQSAGAIIMKEALRIAVDKLDAYGYPYKLVAQVHDEMQLEVPEDYATKVGAVVRNSIRDAGRALNLRCPLDGEYGIGDTWADTH